jgi:hypothetical protein
MKTPSFELREVLDSPHSPLVRSEAILHTSRQALTPVEEDSLRDSMRILRAVLKSAAQNYLAPLASAPSPMTLATETISSPNA